MSVRVEIAVQDEMGLEVAARAGAHRVELCVDLDRGGLTPPVGLVERCARRAAELVSSGDARAVFDVHVLIRCRAGDDDFLGRPDEFAFASQEVDLMAQQAYQAVSAGAAGVVLGALTPDGVLDLPAMEQMRDAALEAAQASLRSVTLTAHRAVDAMPDADGRADAVATLLGAGFHRVLSSGGAARSLDGVAGLARMVAASEGLLDVCAGGGVRPADIEALVRRSGITDVHLSARRRAGSPREADAPDTTTDPAIAAAAVDAAGAL